MGAYTGLPTSHALLQTQTFCFDRCLETELEKQLVKTVKFIENPPSPLSLLFLANLCEASSHRNCANIQDLVSIDWSRWRMATELRLLQWRIDCGSARSRRQLSWVEASHLLGLAIGVTLMGQKSVAVPIFSWLSTNLPPVLDQMTSRKGKSRNWGAVDFAFQNVMQGKDLPKHFRVEPPQTLEQAKLARPTYSDNRDPHGSLLSHPGTDLIPLELVLFSRHLGHPETELADMGAQIQATSYPTNPTFQEMDVALSIAGL